MSRIRQVGRSKPENDFHWPCLRKYTIPSLDRIAMPLGGIGTGSIGFSGNGSLRDWEVMNVPAKGYVPTFAGGPLYPGPSIILRLKEKGKPPYAKVLEGPVPDAEYEGPQGCTASSAGLPRFRKAEFLTAYPLGEVVLKDSDFPFAVRLQAFNPLVPGEMDQSGYPVAFFRCVLKNSTSAPIQASLCFSLPNFIGADGSEYELSQHDRTPEIRGFKRNENIWRVSGGIRGIEFRSAGVDPRHPAWGTMSLTTTARKGVSYRTAWLDREWGGSMLLDFWEDLLKDGGLDARKAGYETPIASLCIKTEIRPGETAGIPILLAWHFPNRIGWRFQKEGNVIVGNHYCRQFPDAWTAARKFWKNQRKLEARTLEFVQAFLAGKVPRPLAEAALFNLSTLRTQTCYRAADGRFFAWEGCAENAGSCFGSANHVLAYEQTLAHFFPELSKSLHRTAFLEHMDKQGFMPFRVALAKEPEVQWACAAADGQMAHVLRVYREWKNSGDGAFFRDLWPAVKKAMEFCWIPGGWDADEDGVMEGCQHNTMDVEYFGPNPQMTGWYLAALRAAQRMALHARDKEFAEKCGRLFHRGRAWVDRHLFNGEYYEHQIRLPSGEKDIAERLRLKDTPVKIEPKPLSQLGRGCLIDQLVGDWAAQLCGLGRVFKAKQTKKTLRSILKYNCKTDLWGHFNHRRTFALGDESALLMGSYPRGGDVLERFQYCNEVMTGFEYVLAGHLILEGMRREGVERIRAIRNRYDGRRRNPYNEAECGYHYTRALSSWGAYLAWTGFRYDALQGSFHFRTSGPHFWACGSGWGTFTGIRSSESRLDWRLEVKGGKIAIKTLAQGARKLFSVPKPVLLKEGQILQGKSTKGDAK